MLHSLLVPVDGSSAGEWCLPLATRVARSTGARLHLAHVHVPYEPDELLANTSFQWEGVDLKEYDDGQVDREAEYLRGLEERLSKEGATVDSMIIEGTPIADELAEYAAEVDADLIVMTSRGRSGLSRVLLGSVSDEVIRKARAPVLVVHPDETFEPSGTPRTVDHVLVALDGSPLAERILDPVRELARATGARLTLIHVVPDPMYLGPRITGLRPHRFDPELDGAIAYLEDVAETLRFEGFEVDALVVHGDDPARALSKVADDQGVDLIAVATHGLGGVKRAVLGSVTDGLLRRTRRPLLVVRPPTDDEGRVP